jgi:hypothetical protein
MHISTIAPISNRGAPQLLYRTFGVWPAYDVGVKFRMKLYGVTNRYPRGCHV